MQQVLRSFTAVRLMFMCIAHKSRGVEKRVEEEAGDGKDSEAKSRHVAVAVNWDSSAAACLLRCSAMVAVPWGLQAGGHQTKRVPDSNIGSFVRSWGVMACCGHNFVSSNHMGETCCQGTQVTIKHCFVLLENCSWRCGASSVAHLFKKPWQDVSSNWQHHGACSWFRTNPVLHSFWLATIFLFIIV